MKMRRVFMEEEQRDLELLSRKNVRGVVRRAIEEELDSSLMDWTIKAGLKLKDWFETEHEYEQKVERVRVLKEARDLEWYLVEIAAAVLHVPSTLTLTLPACAGWLSSSLPDEVGDVWVKVKMAASLLAVCEGLGLYDLMPGSPHKVERHHELDQETFGWINEMGFNLPMVCRPKEVTSNGNAGYLGIRESVILGGRLKYHDEPLALDVLNIMNGIEWELDDGVLTEPEVPSKPLDTAEKFQNFSQQAAESQTVYELLRKAGGKFHFVHQFDSRGRIYQHGYHVHHQSFQYKKGMLNFARKERVTATGMKWLKVDVANQFGLDKLRWKERLLWVKQNHRDLESRDVDADRPILYRKAVRALRAAERGEAVGTPVGLDATSSGLQMMACMSGCRATARAVNLISTGRREDVYTRLGKDLSALLGRPIERKDLKRSIMTAFYGSTRVPEEIFGEKSKALDAFFKLMETGLPGAWELLKLFQSHWDPGAEFFQWKMPDGHTVRMPVMVLVDKRIEVDEFQHRTFTYRTKIVHPKKKGLSMAANITHSVDAWVLREMVRKADKQGFQLSTIHDCFYAHPNYMELVRKNYREVLAELSQMGIVNDILGQLTGKYTGYTKRSSGLEKDILKAVYALS